MHGQDLALNNPQGLRDPKTQPPNHLHAKIVA